MDGDELAAMAQRLDHGYNQVDKLYYEVARACGLPECSYWMIYDIVQHGGSRPVAALCSEWGYSKQTINSALKHLSMRGLVDLVYAEGSRKNKVAQLTAEGTRFSKRFIAPALDAEVKALSTLTATERKRFEALEISTMPRFRSSSRSSKKQFWKKLDNERRIYMKTLVRFLKPHKGLVALTLLVLLIDNAGTLLVPTMLANMVNVGITSGSTEYILRNSLLMLGATAMASGGAVTGSYLTARLASRVACDIRCAIYRKSLEFSASDFERFGTGAMITRTLGDINVIQQAIIMTCQLVLPMPVLAVVGIILAFRIDYQMGLMLLIAVAIVMVLAVITVAKTAPIFIRLQNFIDRMNVVLREHIIGARVIRAFGREEREEEREGRVFGEYAQNAIRVNYVFSGLDCSCFFVMNMVEVCVIWLGGNRVGAHAMQIASISAVLEYAILILFYIMTAQMVMVTMPRAKACLERAREVLELEPSIVDSADAKMPSVAAEPARALAGERDVVARFDHASFRFADADQDTLHDLTFSCRRGQTTAIIGSTGSGKSTVAKLLLRLHDITRGRVLLGERDVRDITQRELRAHISYVPQKAWLFSGTVASNLRDGLPDATEEQMRHALDIAQSQFVYDLERGLDAAVAQGGTNFSGGQRQRLAIARAIIKPADLYIFDDSFSALDFKTDAALRAALTQEMRGAALLIIAQRISTILHADQIIVLKDGEVVGQGRHEELMETCEVYRAIAESQMRGGEAHE